MWCNENQAIGPFFFAKKTINGIMSLICQQLLFFSPGRTKNRTNNVFSTRWPIDCTLMMNNVL